MTMKQPYDSGLVTIDGFVIVDAQYRIDYFWNGWLMVTLDAWSCVHVLDKIAVDDPTLTYSWDGDVLVVTNDDDDNGYVERYEADDDGLYALGAGGWVWSAIDVPCEWYALCENSARGVVAHPMLDDVPTCQRCADRHSLDLQPFEEGA